MKVLGIETSCDETAAAVVEDGYRLLSNVVASSMDKHAAYGGIVPEIAARSHIEVILDVIDQALLEAKCDWPEIDAIAVTYGAGLGGSLLIGVMTARTLAITKNKPFYAVNHVVGHIYANFLTETSLNNYALRSVSPLFPMLAIIVSGGHSQLALFSDHFNYRLLGRTQDDAIGEAFDKVGKMLGLDYPGGISVSLAALNGDPYSVKLPTAKVGEFDFSFSGLKTAVLRHAQSVIGEDYRFRSSGLSERLTEAQKADICASFQRVAIDTVVSKASLAAQQFSANSLVIAGGVAANLELRKRLSEAVKIDLEFPDQKLCTDNGAMIAALGCYMHKLGEPQADPYSLEIEPNLSM